MSRLADILNVSLSNATGLIDRLEERGYIERERVPTDRRIVLVRLTDAGVPMLDEVDALSDDLMRSVLERLPASQLGACANAIAALRGRRRRRRRVEPGSPRRLHARSTIAAATIRGTDLGTRRKGLTAHGIVPG